MANNPRVPCVMETHRRPDYSDAVTGERFTPEGVPIANADVMILCGVANPGPGTGPVDEIGTVSITGPSDCTVGFSAQFAASWTGGIEADTVTFSIDGGSTGTANITTATDNPAEINFTGAGDVIINVSVAATGAGDTPQTGTLTVTVV